MNEVENLAAWIVAFKQAVANSASYAALQTADEAFMVARRRTDRIAELHAIVLRGLIICALGSTSHDELDGLVSEAQNLLKVSGAAYFEPQLDQLRLHLERRRERHHFHFWKQSTEGIFRWDG